MTLKEQYEIYRDYVKHEDSLINHRLTWCLTFHGFLFAGLGFSLQRLIGRDLDQQSGVYGFLLILVFFIMPASGALTGWFSGQSIVAAHEAINKLKAEWTTVYAEAKGTDPVQKFPELTGGGSEIANRTGLHSSLWMTRIMLGAWLIVFVFGVSFVIVPRLIQADRSAERTLTPALSSSSTPPSVPQPDITDPRVAAAVSQALLDEAQSGALSRVLIKTSELVDSGLLSPALGVRVVETVMAEPGVASKLAEAAGRTGIDLGAEWLRTLVDPPQQLGSTLKKLGEQAGKAGIRVAEDGLKRAIEAALRPEPKPEPKDDAKPRWPGNTVTGNSVVVNCAPPHPAYVALPAKERSPCAECPSAKQAAALQQTATSAP